MFLGSIPDPMRSIVRETVADWPIGDLHVPCCGNFTIERAIAGLGWKVHSSDVSIYTTAVGRWATGQPVGLTLKPESQERLEWLAGSLDDGTGTVAAMMLATNFLDCLDKHTPYHRRQVAAYRDNWADLHQRTVEKLNKAELHVDSYEARDVREVLDNIPTDEAICTFPPFYGGGYETMWKPLEQHFDWDRPDYAVLSEQDVRQVIETIADRPRWLVATNQPVDQLADHHRGTIKTTPRAAPFHVYGAAPHSRIVAPRQKIEPVHARRLRPGDVIGDRMALAPLTAGQFNALRSQYLNPRIAPGSADAAFAVVVDGLICGVLAVSRGQYDPTAAYMMSDFAVAPTDYPRLSKLVLLAVQSKEMQLLLQRQFSRRVRSIVTTAFTNNPVSMKYRGLFELTKRSESDDPAWEFQLQYEAPAGQHTLAQALGKWKARWSR